MNPDSELDQFLRTMGQVEPEPEPENANGVREVTDKEDPA